MGRSSDEVKKSASELVLWFFQARESFQETKDEFEKLKTSFEGDMEEFFKATPDEKTRKFSYDEFDEGFSLSVTRAQRVDVSFDADKLEKALGKQAKSVVLKRYEVTDMSGLISYLKECGVDPKIFKSFIEVSKTVDTKMLDNLEERGKISKSQIEGCYSVKVGKPYFIVKKQEGRKDDGQGANER